MVEARFLKVLPDKAWELSVGKENAAEGKGLSHKLFSWAAVEDAADCHNCGALSL